jgi:RND superfamily putative drug exporter
VLVVALVLVATLLADGLTTEFTYSNNPDSKIADALLEERLRGPRRVNEVVIVQSDELVVDDPAFEEKVHDLFGAITGLGAGVIQSGVNYYMIPVPALVADDRHTTIIPLVMAGSFDDAMDNVEQLTDLVAAADGRDGFRVLIAGEASISLEANKISERDLIRGEGIGIPVALVILMFVFGALVAAFIPLLVAIFAIAIAIGGAALMGQIFQLSWFVTNMITMIGLAVGIDYTLFVVSRFREERRRGHQKIDAIGRTGATASRAVLFSGVTVVLALIGLLVIPTNIFQSLGAGAILVVIVSVLIALTLLPAVLGLLGDRVDSLRLPYIGRKLSRSGGDESTEGFWNWVTHAVMDRPVVSLVLTVGVLLALAVPAFDLNTGFNGVASMPEGSKAKEAFLLLEDQFSFGVVLPLEIVVDGDINSDAVKGAIERLNTAMERDPAFVGSPVVQVNDAGDLALISITLAGEAAGEVAEMATRAVRDDYVPGAFGGVDARVYATGGPAFNVDFYDITDRFTPIVFAIVLGLSFMLLTVVFRSIVVPIKAIIMNLLSVGAAYGLMVLVFQKGYGADLLGFQQSAIIDAWIPLFLFSVLFGLSMDYHVFMLSRIRERYDQTGDNAASVAYGLRSTGGLITGAALIMVAVFGGFAMGDLVGFQQVGFGLAVAVLLDATIVRSVLVPASMRLLGDLNWYLPKGLSWLPDLRVEPEEAIGAPAPGD